MNMRSIKKVTALTVLSFLASQMSTTALMITEGVGEVENFKSKTPKKMTDLGTFRNKNKGEAKKTKTVSCVTIDFKENNERNFKEKYNKSISIDDNTEEIMRAIRSGEDIEWNVVPEAKLESRGTQTLFKFENISSVRHTEILNAFFKEGLLTGDEVHIMNPGGSKMVVTQNRVEFYGVDGGHIKLHGDDYKNYIDMIFLFLPQEAVYELDKFFYNVGEPQSLVMSSDKKSEIDHVKSVAG